MADIFGLGQSMTELLSVANGFGGILPLLRTLVVIVIVFSLFSLSLRIIKKRLLKIAKTRKQISNVHIFSRVVKVIFFIVLLIAALLSYAGSWGSLGLFLGLVSAAIGFALQKPIAGIAAWMMVIMRRPFNISDRVVIGTVKGDVRDITLSHIYLEEVGGILQSEECSGRIVLVPNSRLFEENIINYTLQDDFVLDQVVTTVTYESNLDKAMKIALSSAKVFTDEFKGQMSKPPFVRIKFEASGIDVSVRYFVPARRRQEISSGITKEIFNSIRAHKDVEIAYPHTEVVFRKKEK